MPLLKMEHKIDPKEELFNKFKGLEEFKIYGAQILIATYIRPEKTASGLYLSAKTIDEDIYQGKVGLVLKVGTAIYDEEDKQHFGDYEIKVGDWVVYRASDGFNLNLLSREGHCRLLDRRNVKLITNAPDLVW